MRLQLDDAGIVYQRGTAFEQKGVSAVTLELGQGERVAVAGPIGSGKSSLLTILSGIELPHTGSLLIDGVEVSGEDPVERGSIGVAFQSPEDNLFEKTVFDDVAFAPRSLGLSDTEVRRRVEAALATVGLDPAGFGGRNPFSLSSGEQRRVALAGVLALEPRLLLLDEPTAFLDPRTRADIITRLVDLNRESGTTVVMVGHDMDELALFADRLIIMDGGSVAADGPAAELLTAPELLQRYGLEPPGTVRLCRLLSGKLGRPVEPVLGEDAAVELLYAALQHGGGG